MPPKGWKSGKLSSGATPEQSPRRERKQKFTQKMASSIVQTLNGLVVMFDRERTWALADYEETAAAEWLIALAQSSKFAENFLLNLVSYNRWGKLVMIPTGIAIPRLARAGYLPEEMASWGPALLVLSQIEVDISEPVETGGAHSTDRHDGLGQDDAGPEASDAPTLDAYARY